MRSEQSGEFSQLEEAVAFYAQTEIGQELIQRGYEEGLQQVLAQGSEEGNVRTLTRVLQARFGADPRIPQLAAGLVRLPDQAIAVKAAVRAQNLDELAQLIGEPTREQPPSAKPTPVGEPRSAGF